MVKPNFFKAIATGVVLWRVFQYIGNQRRLLEQWDYNIKALRLVGFAGGELKFDLEFDLKNNSGATMSAGLFDFDVYIDGIRAGRAISNNFIDIQPYSSTAVSFDIRVKPSELGSAGKQLVKSIDKIGSIPVKIVGNFSVETLPGVYKTVPVNFTDTASNLFFGE